MAMPLLLDPVNSKTTMMLMVKIPLAPTPVIDLPRIYTRNPIATALVMHPAAYISVYANMHIRGEKTDASFPFRGASELIAMR